MTTCRDIVRRALRKIGVVGTGREPSQAQAADALGSLQSLYVEWMTSGAFGVQYDVTTATDVVARPGQRILKTAPGVVVTLPTVVDNGNPCDCRWDYGFVYCSPQLLDLAFVTEIDQTTGAVLHHLFDAGRGAWVTPDVMDLNDPAPLATRGPEGLSALLAVRMADDYGEAVQPGALTIAQAKAFQSSILTRFGSVRQATYAEFC